MIECTFIHTGQTYFFATLHGKFAHTEEVDGGPIISAGPHQVYLKNTTITLEKALKDGLVVKMGDGRLEDCRSTKKMPEKITILLQNLADAYKDIEDYLTDPERWDGMS